MTKGFNFPGAEKFMSRMFRKADGVVWDLMTGKIGVITDEGITSLDGEGEDARINVNLMDEFGIALPAFAQSTPLADVKIGDIIYRNSRDNISWIVGVNADKGTFRVMKPNGETTSWAPPKVTVLGFESGVMVLRSLMSMLPNGNQGLNQMQGMLMPLIMSGGLSGDDEEGSDMLEKMMPMMLMSQMGGGTDGGGGMGNMVQMMFMMKAMGGGMGDMFGGKSKSRRATYNSADDIRDEVKQVRSSFPTR